MKVWGTTQNLEKFVCIPAKLGSPFTEDEGILSKTLDYLRWLRDQLVFACLGLCWFKHGKSCVPEETPQARANWDGWSLQEVT